MVYLSTACIKSDSVLDAISTLSSITKNIEISGGSKYQDDLIGKIIGLKNKEYNFLVQLFSRT